MNRCTSVRIWNGARLCALALLPMLGQACTEDEPNPMGTQPNPIVDGGTTGGGVPGGAVSGGGAPGIGVTGGGTSGGGVPGAGIPGGGVPGGGVPSGGLPAGLPGGQLDGGVTQPGPGADGGPGVADGGLPGGGGDAGIPVGAPAEVMGCGATKLYATNDEDTGMLGPWPVGVKTLKVPVGGATLTTEVWYPAKLGSNQGKAKQEYDLRSWLPMGAVPVPDSANKMAVCECYRDLPLDTDHGPYPVVVFIHGLGSMRISSMSATAQWASRGFIVIAADHPGDMLTDFLVNIGFGWAEGCSSSGADPGDMAAEANGVIAALKAKSSGFDFLGSAADTTRMALGGHSQGGGTVAAMANTEGVKVVITLAPLGGGALNAPVESMLQVTGTIDNVTGYSTAAYQSDRSMKRRHVGIANGGHIDVTDLCKEKNPQGKTGIEVASEAGVCGASVLAVLAQCGGDAAATPASPLIVNYATTAALEETLHCKNRDAAFNALKAKFPAISEFLHTP
jgi:pimeloyl-ACP methyl ester carboxylesterase